MRGVDGDKNITPSNPTHSSVSPPHSLHTAAQGQPASLNSIEWPSAPSATVALCTGHKHRTAALDPCVMAVEDAVS